MNGAVREAAAALCRAGVRASFGVTGSGMSWQLITALNDRGVPYHAAAHEAAAAIMAGAFARQSNTLGCSISIRGPGLANMAAGILSNQYEQWPSLSVSEAYDPSRPSPRMHKRLDHRALTAPLVKDYGAGMHASTIERLASCARSEIPGPVHLDFMPGDPAVGDPRPSHAVRSKSDRDNAWDEIRRRVDAARRPILAVGALATRSPWASRLKDLGFPVFTTVSAKGVLDERHPAAAGIFTGDGKSLAPESVIAPEADLLVGFGLRSHEVLTPKPIGITTLMLDAADDASLVNGFDACSALAGAAPEHFEEILNGLESKSWGADLTAGAMRDVRNYLTRDEWLPGRVFETLQNRVTDDVCVVVDTGAFATVAEHVWQAATPVGFVASANGRYMGTSMPMAIGATLARQTTPTLCVMGDGGIRSFWAEIRLAVSESLPICFVLMSDGRYGSVAAVASAPGLTPAAVDIPNPSWFKAAEAVGCPAYRVTSLDTLASAIDIWCPSDGPCFIEAPFAPEPYAAMTEEVR